MSRLLVSGDWHIGAGADLGRAPGDRLRDQALVLDRIADLATDSGVDGVLLAGDVFNGPGVPPEQLEVFARFIDRCHSDAIPILAISGNGVHDLAMRETNGLAIFSRIAGIRVSSTPEIIEMGDLYIATLPWVHPGRLIAEHGGGDRDRTNETAAELLVKVARDLYSRVPVGARSVLLAHWSVSGAALPNGIPTDQLREPVIDLRALEEIGFDAIVLGHIHRFQLLSNGPLVTNDNGSHVTGRDCPIFYVGSPMPLSFGETGSDHGVVLLEID